MCIHCIYSFLENTAYEHSLAIVVVWFHSDRLTSRTVRKRMVKNLIIVRVFWLMRLRQTRASKIDLSPFLRLVLFTSGSAFFINLFLCVCVCSQAVWQRKKLFFVVATRRIEYNHNLFLYIYCSTLHANV